MMNFSERYEGYNWDCDDLTQEISDMYDLVEDYIIVRLDCDWIGVETPHTPTNLHRWIEEIEDMIELYLDYMMDDDDEVNVLPQIVPVEKPDPKDLEKKIQKIVADMIEQEDAIEKTEKEILLKLNPDRKACEVPCEWLEHEILNCQEGKEIFSPKEGEIAERIIEARTELVLKWME